ncbi:hypothetical protein MXD63_43150, partial [Frankia sp. Cpl3]|nr:hypothetical protein [Frankia sp. Cpl3]
MAGCGGQNSQSATPSGDQAKKPGAAALGQADMSSKLRLNLKTEPPSLDPPKGFDSTSNMVLNATMEGLVRLDKDHKPQPAMAEKWEVSPD